MDPQANNTWVRTWNKSGPANYENVPAVADWETSLGDFDAVGAFVTAVQADIAQLGWRGALQLWCSRLLPGLGTRMFHGMLRVAHAVCALRCADVPRRRELSLAIAVWATRWGKAKPLLGIGTPAAAELLLGT